MIKVLVRETGAICSMVATLAEAIMISSLDESLIIDPIGLMHHMRSDAKNSVIEMATAYGESLTAGYPKSEQASWPVKIVEARAILNGETRPMFIPTIATECSFTDISLTDTATYILAKSAPFAMASGAISGIRQVAFKQIESAIDASEIEAAVATAKASLSAAFSLV